jgi:hypothetical protein
VSAFARCARGGLDFEKEKKGVRMSERFELLKRMIGDANFGLSDGEVTKALNVVLEIERDLTAVRQERELIRAQLEDEKASHAETWKLLAKTMEQRDAMESGLKGLVCGLLVQSQSEAGEKGEAGNTDQHGPARTDTDVECWAGEAAQGEKEAGHGG